MFFVNGVIFSKKRGKKSKKKTLKLKTAELHSKVPEVKMKERETVLYFEHKEKEREML